MQATWADYIIVAIIGLSVLVSIIRGFVREALSLMTWVAAFWVAFHFLNDLRALLEKYIHTPSLQYIAAFLVLLILVLIVGNIVSYLLAKMIDITGLGGTDRVLGSVFGLARGALLVAALLLVLSFTAVTKDNWWQNSLLIQHFEPLELWLKGLLPDSITGQFKLINNQ